MVDKVIERLNLDAEVTRNIDEADVVISHKSYSKGGAKFLLWQNIQASLQFVKSNTMPQIQKALKDALNIADATLAMMFLKLILMKQERALQEVQSAVHKILNGLPEIELEQENSI